MYGMSDVPGDPDRSSPLEGGYHVTFNSPFHRSAPSLFAGKSNLALFLLFATSHLFFSLLFSFTLALSVSPPPTPPNSPVCLGHTSAMQLLHLAPPRALFRAEWPLFLNVFHHLTSSSEIHKAPRPSQSSLPVFQTWVQRRSDTRRPPRSLILRRKALGSSSWNHHPRVTTQVVTSISR